jgi:hypothetical protein
VTSEGTEPPFLVTAELADSAIAAALAEGSRLVTLAHRDLRPAKPFEGRLFEVLAAAASGDTTSVAREATGEAPGRAAGAARRLDLPPAASGTASVRLLVPAVWLAPEQPPDAFSVADHVNLRLRGALTGRWPAGAPRAFPELNTVYEREPPFRRPPPGARVYSGLVVAGVGNVRALTHFEGRAIDQLSLPAASDCLVDAVIVAACYGLSVAAWCVPLAP